MRFDHHVVVSARCTKRWRGANFDAAAAQGNLGAAVAEVLGLSVRTSEDLETFYRHAFIQAYGQGLDPNPAATFDATEGEAFEFHVGLRKPLDPETLARVKQAAREAVAKSRHFELA